MAELTAAEQEAVAAHLAACSACSARWDSSVRSAELDEAVQLPRDTQRLKDAVMARIGGEPGEPRESGAEEPVSPATRQRLGGFELLDRLGRGGMGTVLKARQITMDRVVALKILPRRLAENEKFVKRFIREARAAARLRHPHIVQAYDVGKAEGYFYFAMEYVEGETLDAILRRDGPMEPPRALAAMKQVCSALAAAHDAGIVHRDIKPSNIMLDAHGDVRVMDFGLAKRAEGDIAATADGSAIGTPAYMSPEMARGGEAEPRSDLYSLGATFFYVLAGRPPFQGKSYAEVIVKHVNEEAPPLATVAPHVDRRLGAIIDRLLRKSPEARYASAQALVEELDALGEIEPRAPAPLPAEAPALQDAPTLELSAGRRMLRQFEAKGRRARRGAKRLRVASIAAGGAMAVLAIALVVWVIAQRSPGLQATSGRPTTGASTRAELVEHREHNARVVFDRARSKARLSQWPTVVRDLDRLKQEYGDTKFYAANRIAIDELRARAEAHLKLQPTTRTTVQPQPPPQDEWVSLFDRKTLDSWRVAERGVFAEHGPVATEEGQIVLGPGKQFTGITWAGEFPRADYEVVVEAQRTVAQPHEFCSMVFPVGDASCVLVVGGRGGYVVGLSCVDGQDVSKNLTKRAMPFETGQWYRVRLRVTAGWVDTWIDDRHMPAVPRAGHVFTLPDGHDDLEPFGIYSAHGMRSAVRSIRLRRVRPTPVEPLPPAGEWMSLFDGKSLTGWRVVEEFAKPHKGGKAGVENGRIVLEQGHRHTALAWTGELPTEDYELCVEAMRLDGKGMGDLIFPIGSSHCKLDIAAWDGDTIGLSEVDRQTANANPTTSRMVFENGRWYRIRLRVRTARVEAWIDDRKVVDLPTEGHRLRLDPFFERAKPLALHTWMAKVAVRDVRFRCLEAGAVAPPPVAGAWQNLFDGRTLNGWRVVEGNVFQKHGKVHAKDECLVLDVGEEATGAAWTGEFPEVDYELVLETKCFPGGFNFCNIVFPVGASSCTLGMVAGPRGHVGLHAIDGKQREENLTTRSVEFERDRWYAVRLRVTAAAVRVWLDATKVIDLPTAGHTIATRGCWWLLKPLGLGAWHSGVSFRNIRVRRLPPEADRPDRERVETATIAVPARAVWFDPGLEVSNGETYTITATGRWGTSPEHAFGPNGGALKTPAFFPLPGTPRYGLIGRIGPNGQPFVINRGRGLLAEESGRLVMMMNDANCEDNWGSLRVTVQGPLVVAPGAPLLSRFLRELGQVSVEARSDFTAAGVELKVGEVVLVTAQGRWLPKPGQRVDADGTATEIRGQRLGALLGRIGEQGTPFHVGTLHVLEPEEPGPLYLAMCDDDRGDSAGSVTVSFRALGPPPEPKEPREANRQAAVAAYAEASDKVWALLKERRYEEAEKLAAGLAEVADYRLAADRVAADATAAKLLKALWAAVEAGLAARRGRPFTIAGAEGDVVAVKNGLVTIRTKDGLAVRPVLLLTASQALGLAEGDDPDAARKALDAAGDAPHIAIYKARLVAQPGR